MDNLRRQINMWKQHSCIYCNYQQDDWAYWLPIVQYAINARPSATTKQAPYELWMGFIPRVHQPDWTSEVPAIEKHKEQIKDARKQALEAMKWAQKLLGRKCYNYGRTISYLFFPYLISLDPITFCTIPLRSASFHYLPYASVTFQTLLLHVLISSCVSLMNYNSLRVIGLL
jgi:hypothetical protein